jgi:hypothetical protein
MKPITSEESCLGLDRLATWDEVRYAMASWSQGASQPGCGSDGYCDQESDFIRVDVRPKKAAWSPLRGKKLDPKNN